jgi:hypothetical protein
MVNMVMSYTYYTNQSTPRLGYPQYKNRQQMVHGGLGFWGFS